MKTDFELVAELREAQGKGASRRLRRENKVPAILYGGQKEARPLALDANKLMQALEDERFYSTIINLKAGNVEQAAVLKDVQRHPSKSAILHVDLQRVRDDEQIRMSVPLHFVGEDGAPGVKAGGQVSHLQNEVEIICLPKDLPEFLEVDLSTVEMNEMRYLSDIRAPEGVEIVELGHDNNLPVASVHHARVEEVLPVEGEGEEVPVAEAGEAAAEEPKEGDEE